MTVARNCGICNRGARALRAAVFALYTNYLKGTMMSRVIIKFTINLPPVTKKNSQRIVKRGNRYIILPSEKYEEYENAALWLVPKRGVPIDFPVNVKCLFYMPTKRLCDLTNHLEAIDDVMVKAGLLKDDNYKILVSHDGSRVLVDKDNPRTEVEITPM
jgi:Holliday junction resolvase RusA-like endonuclease